MLIQTVALTLINLTRFTKNWLSI